MYRQHAFNLSQLVSQSIFSTDGRVTFAIFNFYGEAINVTNSVQSGFSLMYFRKIQQDFVPIGAETLIYRLEGVLVCTDCTFSDKLLDLAKVQKYYYSHT